MTALAGDQLDILDAIREALAETAWIGHLTALAAMTRPELVAANEADRAACLDRDGRPILPASDRCDTDRHKTCQHLDSARQDRGGPLVCFCSCHYSTDDLRLMAQERYRNDLLAKEAAAA